MTPKKVNTTLLILLVALILASGGGLFFANRALTNMAQRTSRLSAQIEVSKKQVDLYELTQIKVEALDYVGDLANRVLPEEQDQSVIVAELSQFALRSRLTVAGIEFAEQAQGSAKKTKTVPAGVEIVPMSIKFEGVAYENLLNFLRLVENNQRKMQVNNINLKPNDDNRSELTEVTVSINLYAKKAAAVEKKQ